MFTEEEAKAKWCPFARTLASETVSFKSGERSVVGASINREVGDYDKEGGETVSIYGRHRCIASQCMAWRVGHMKSDPITGNGTPLGYCGLAGNPA